MKSLALILALALAGCAAGVSPTGQTNDPLSALAQLTDKDLIRAKAVADAGGDKLASTCYGYLSSKLESGVPGSNITAGEAGLITGFEQARLLVRNGKGVLTDDFYAACGGFISSVRGETLGAILPVK